MQLLHMLGVDTLHLGFLFSFQRFISNLAAFGWAASISGKQYAVST
jgi:hypothetical protein